MSDTPELDAAYIAGLLRERGAYEAAGDDDHVKQVDAELRRVGYKAAAPAKRAESRPARGDREKRA